MRTTKLTRRDWLLRSLAIAPAAGLAPIVWPGVAAAQDASAPVRLVVPFSAGTTTDNVARVVGNAMAQVLGQRVIVDNKPGAGGPIATDQVAKAAADGKTLVMGTVGTHAINPSLFRKLPYDPVKDFAPVAFAGYTPLLLLVPAASTAKTPQDLARLARRPDGCSFASAGNGTAGHLAGEMLATQGGKLVHVPYKDGAQALTDLIAGNVDFMFYHPTAVMQHIKSGKLRVLGTSSLTRSKLVPDAAPLAEQGLPGFNLVAWLMVYAPARVPPQTLAQLRAAAATALAQADTQSRLDAQGIEGKAMNDEALAQFTRQEVAKWAELVKRSGAQVD